MSYFGGSTSPRGDPGFFGSLFGAAKGFVTGGPGGAISGAISGFRGGQRPAAVPRAVPSPFQAPRRGPLTGVQLTGFGLGGPRPGIRPVFGPNGQMMPRRRRMNVTNPKALRRAIRRTDGFVRIARSALKNTGFKIVSKSAGRMTEAQWQKRAHHAK